LGANQNVTILLDEAARGSESASAELLAQVYGELKVLAEGLFRDQKPWGTLQPTAVVHEAYLRLVGQEITASNRAQFFALASKAMRSVLVDHARSRGRVKRGNGWERVSFEAIGETPLSSVGVPVEEVALALDELAALDERKARLVELRFFGGMTSEQAADVLDISRSTAAEEWRTARAWLHHRLKDRLG
jgi:RNA polymerase sigma-70 factor, ECF subfamily